MPAEFCWHNKSHASEHNMAKQQVRDRPHLGYWDHLAGDVHHMHTRTPSKQSLRQQLAGRSCNVRPVPHLQTTKGRTCQLLSEMYPYFAAV
jgi:hypothetical protein